MRKRGGGGRRERQEEEEGGRWLASRCVSDSARGSWRMAPGVSAESSRTRKGPTVSKTTSDSELCFQRYGVNAVLSPSNFAEKFRGPEVRFLLTESAGK